MTDGESKPDEDEKKAGKYLLLKLITGIPLVSRYYRVRGISKIDFTPADTTVTGVLPNYYKSALTSITCSKPRWTPPIPPVTKISMPAAWAPIIVPETVVAPIPFRAIIVGRSLLLTFFTSLPVLASSSICDYERPTCILPSKMAIVAGTAPPSRIVF